LQPAAAAPKTLSAADRADVTRVEDYLNKVRSLKAGFSQVAPDGALSGTFYLSRPGRMRFEYDPPTPLLTMADGTWIVVRDAETRHVDRIRSARRRFGAGARRGGSGRGHGGDAGTPRPGVLEISLVDPGNREQGSITSFPISRWNCASGLSPTARVR
jgi:uncharacterized protein YlzI (FlbEa/FlbD family)